MHAVRKNRYVILPKDFEKGYQINVKKPDTDFEFYKWLVLEAHMIMPLLGLLKVIITKAASGDMEQLYSPMEGLSVRTFQVNAVMYDAEPWSGFIF